MRISLAILLGALFAAGPVFGQGIDRLLLLSHPTLDTPVFPTGHGPAQVLFRRSPPEACGDFEAISPVLSANVDGMFRLLASRVPCKAFGKVKPSECRWTITPRPRDAQCRCRGNAQADCAPTKSFSGSVRLNDKIEFLQIPMPDQTGAYTLDLTCDDREILKDASLYSTIGPPMTWVRPPQRHWYERAVCWGEGLTAQTPESDALTAIQGGLFRHGLRHWRYGYGRLDETQEFVLFPAEEELRIPLDEEDVVDPDPDQCCQCSWQALVEDSSACNFSDCYVFSETLQAIAAVFGIGGLLPETYRGDFGVGFLVRPGVRSPDLSDFSKTGNLRCADDVGVCGAYVFGAHNLRRRDGSVYDATFNTVSTDFRESVSHQILYDVDGTVLAHRDGEVFEIPQIPSEYGRWWHGRLQRREQEEALSSHPIKFLDAEISAQIDEEIRLSKLLKVEATIDVQEPGNYLLRGFLCARASKDAPRVEGSPCEGVLISQRPRYETSDFTTAAVRTAEAGETKIRMTFSGEEIHKAGLDGPWEVRIVAGDAVFLLPTSEYRSEDFGELPATIEHIGEVRTFKILRNKEARHFGIPLHLHVRRSGRYAIEMRLHRRDQTLAYSDLLLEKSASRPARGYVDLQRGFSVVAGVFDLSDAKDLDSDFRMTAVLFDGDRRAISGWTSEPMAAEKFSDLVLGKLKRSREKR